MDPSADVDGPGAAERGNRAGEVSRREGGAGVAARDDAVARRPQGAVERAGDRPIGVGHHADAGEAAAEQLAQGGRVRAVGDHDLDRARIVLGEDRGQGVGQGGLGAPGGNDDGDRRRRRGWGLVRGADASAGKERRRRARRAGHPAVGRGRSPRPFAVAADPEVLGVAPPQEKGDLVVGVRFRRCRRGARVEMRKLRRGKAKAPGHGAPVAPEGLVAPEEVGQPAVAGGDLAGLRKPVTVGEGVGPAGRVQPAAELGEAHAQAHAVPGLDEPAVVVSVPPRARVLVGMEGADPLPGMAEEGEAQIVPRLRMAAEDLIEGQAPDQQCVGVRGAERGDDAARGGLGVADPEEPVAPREDLLRPEIRPVPGGGDEGKRGAVVARLERVGEQGRDFAVFRRRRGREAAGERRQRALAEHRQGGAGERGARSGQAARPPQREQPGKSARKVLRLDRHCLPCPSRRRGASPAGSNSGGQRTQSVHTPGYRHALIP